MPDLSFALIWQFATQFVIGLLGLSFLVLIHEGGHFFVAKKFGVRVNTFSIGFGKTLFSFKRGDTEYCIKAIPFGGYVAMKGEQPGDKHSQDSDDFSAKSIPQRMGIAFGGPFVNIVFSFLVLIALFMIGMQEPVSNEITVGKVMEDSPAEEAGIQTGDVITQFGGKPIVGLEQFLNAVAVEANNTLPIQVRRGDEVLDLTITPEMHEMGFAMSGIIPGQTHVQIMKVLGTPAKNAGFQAGDKVISAEGVEVADHSSFSQIVNASQGKELTVMVEREDEELALFVTPELDAESNSYLIGVQITTIFNTPTHLVRRGFTESLKKSWDVNLQNSVAVFVVLKGILRGQVKLKALSGPVGILQIIGNSFRQSFQDFIKFLALISLNLGLINLLPLIITDGGIIFFLFLEAIRKRPLTLKTQMRINQIAVSLFITLALFITFHDILRIPLHLY